MIVLAIDSALDALGAALVDGESVRASMSEMMTRGQAERIAPAVRDVIAEAGLRPADIDRIVVTVGPGSFTGVRVGLAFARGFALALAKPCVGISTLEALALEEGAGGLRGGLIETPGALYIALYADASPALSPRRCERDEAADLLASAANGAPFALRGPGAVAHAKQIAGASGVERPAPDPVALARLGAARDPAHAKPDPLYLRAALT